MLTTAVFAIVVTVPIGGMLINTLGFKWLDHDVDTITPQELPQETREGEKVNEYDLNASNVEPRQSNAKAQTK
jgi:hypothetical protein